jgi:hypothetical protein
MGYSIMTSRIGHRRFRASLYEVTATTYDSGNNPVDVETLKGKRWVSLRSPGGNEFIAGNQVHELTSHILEMHNDSITRKIVSSWIIKVKTRTFQVLEAPDYDIIERESVRISCMEIVGGL